MSSTSKGMTISSLLGAGQEMTKDVVEAPKVGSSCEACWMKCGLHFVCATLFPAVRIAFFSCEERGYADE